MGMGTLKPQPPSDRLTARTCAVCGKPKGTIAFRQDGGSFFAHLPCLRKWRKARAKETGK